MSSKEFTAWQVWNAVTPVDPQEREDLRSGIIAAVIESTKPRKKGTAHKAKKPSDFMPYYDAWRRVYIDPETGELKLGAGGDRPAQSTETMLTIAHAWTAALKAAGYGDNEQEPPTGKTEGPPPLGPEPNPEDVPKPGKAKKRKAGA